MPGGPYYDLTAANAALKELYAGQEVKNLVYKTNPFMALVPKDTEFEGEYKPIPVIIGASQGRSSTFANAQGNQSPVQAYKFLLARRSDYSIATLDNQTMLASRSDKGSFIRGAKTVIDGAFRSITLSLASSLFRSGTGTIGQISSISAGVITLADPNSVVQFELNMVLQANVADGGADLVEMGDHGVAPAGLLLARKHLVDDARDVVDLVANDDAITVIVESAELHG
jgi:hypothetical protein